MRDESGRERSAPRIDGPISAAAPRLAALDALRGAAMLLVVVAHAAISLGATYVPHLLWAVRDPDRATAFDALFWGSISVAMPVFFVLSGFLAAQLVAVRGPVGFLKNRARKIVAPFLAASLTVLPPSLAVWAIGWLISGRCRWRQILKWKFLDPDIKHYVAGPAHLWFLEYLIPMLLAYGLFRLATNRRPRPAGPGLIRLGAPIALAVPTALILWAGHRRLGIDAVLDLRNSFLPDPFRWAHHAWFFAVGAFLHRSRDDLDRLIVHAPWRLALAALAFSVRVRLLRRDLLVPLEGAEAMALAASGALFGWLALFGLLGLAQGCCRRPRGAVRYLADSSYWIYLTHFPVVGLAQVTLSMTSWAAGWKFLAVLGVTLGVGLGSYQVFVRRTRLGRWLNPPPRSRREGHWKMTNDEARMTKEARNPKPE